MASGDGQNIQFPPFRSLQDFCMDTTRFNMPPFRDESKWSNRVVQNLLYYQTNYFAVMIVVILFTGLIFPAEFLYGLVGIICAVMTVVLAISKHHALRQLRGNHPWALLLCLAFLGYMVVTRLRDIAVFAFPFAVSVLVIYLHASLRTRNIKNRITNKLEQLGVKRTPMGMVIELTGYEIQVLLLQAAENAAL